MRRKDKEISDRDLIEMIMHKACICHLGLCNRSMPYVVAVNYGYDGHALYVHSTPKGKKIDLLKNNNRVSFAIESDLKLLEAENACDFSQHYRSVHGTGRAVFVEDETGKKQALDIIMRQHGASGPFEYTPTHLKKVCIIMIEIDSLTGKQSGF
jgi:nitroimidazol reductase NimA-like FMN-containing flavoprotein (pyridoxamine 5'-phosphate oxidase superfamily)